MRKGGGTRANGVRRVGVGGNWGDGERWKTSVGLLLRVNVLDGESRESGSSDPGETEGQRNVGEGRR